jgi:protein-S-isoprenylcysteine O-methyltransferase Ste14
MTKRVLRWLLGTTIIGAAIFAAAGTLRDLWLWAYVTVIAAVTLWPVLRISDDLARERFTPPSGGADRQSLRVIRLVALAHVIVGAMDSGRWHLAPVPPSVRAAALAGVALSFLMVYRAMIENRFFSAVVRIQHERGHHVVDSGPYALVRHPGYAGMIAGVLFSGMALGSWIGFALALVYGALIVRRVLFEDRYLRGNLPGYSDYALRVRYRLVPGAF